MAKKGQHEAAAERRLQAYELRKGGASYRQIGTALHVSEAQAYRDVMGRHAELAALDTQEREALRRLETERLDGLLLGVWPRASAGDENAVRAAVRIMERRARLLGLDAPAKQELTGPGGGPIPVGSTILVTGDEDEYVAALKALRAKDREGKS